MKAEIIAVGSELLTPDHLDTNSLFLTERLNGEGFEVHLKSVVGDDEKDIAEVFSASLRRSSLVILTGGLGPTEDDLTRRAVAVALGRPLRIDSEALESLRRKFASRGYPMPKINERQAEIIEGAEILRNPVGTAPGQFLHHGETRIALLPGPPRELRPMFETQVIPRLAGLSGPRKMFERLLHVTGMTESEVDSKAAHIYGSYPDIRVNILASPGHIALRLRKWSVRDADVLELDELAGRLRDELGDAVFSNRGERLEEALGSMLRRAGLSLAVAESCTSGLVAARITRVPGSSDYFLGGVLCYSNLVKTALCHVPADMLHRHGAVSAEVAEALARGVREVAASRIGLSVTGIAGPGGGSPEKPVGLVFVGICDGDTCTHFCRSIPGDRETVRERTAYFALSSLRRFLLQKGIPA